MLRKNRPLSKWFFKKTARLVSFSATYSTLSRQLCCESGLAYVSVLLMLKRHPIRLAAEEQAGDAGDMNRQSQAPGNQRQ